MIGFVEMALDRRTYRFLQDTRHGRVLIAEGERVDKLVAAITNYIGRRLVERELALASDWRSKEGEPPLKETRARAAELANAAEQAKAPAEETPQPAAAQPPRERSSWLGRAGDVMGFVLTVVGAIT